MKTMMSSSPEKRPTADQLLQRPRLIQLSKRTSFEESNPEVARNLISEEPLDDSNADISGLGPTGGCQKPCSHRGSPETSLTESCEGYDLFNSPAGPVSSTPRRGDKNNDMSTLLARRLFD